MLTFPKSTLGQMLSFYNGKAIKPGGEGQFPVFGSNGVIGGCDEFKYSDGIIVGRVGAYCGSVQYCPGKFWASDNTIVVKPQNADFDVRFLYYLLSDLNLNNYAGGAAQPLVTQTVLKQVEAYSPPLETQRKIASILSAYDDLIENNTRRIKILEEMAQAIYREWFVNFRFPGHEQVKMVDSPLGRVPEGWEVVKLADVAKVNDRSIRTANAPETINYIDISSVSTGSIDKVERLPFAEAPSRARRIVQHGDVIWSTVRPNRKSFSLILTPPSDLVVSTGFAVISPRCVPYTYLYQALTTDEFVGYLVNHATGAAYPAVNAGDFERAGILKPARALLNKYHEMTEGIFLLRHRLIAKNQNLRQARDLLLPKLISGEVEVSEMAV